MNLNMNISKIIAMVISTISLAPSTGFSQEFWPSRPQFKRHQTLIQGQTRHEYELYHSQRVGACLSPEQVKLIDQKVLSQSFKSEFNKLQELNCQRNSKVTSPFETLQGKTKVDTALNIRSAHSSWRLAMQKQDSVLSYLLSKHLKDLPYPKRTQERLQLSYVQSIIELLNLGPSPFLNTEAETGLGVMQSLYSLAEDALGVQVRARALQSIKDHHPYVDNRQEALFKLWHDYPQTKLSHLVLDAPELDWLRRGEAAFKARDYQQTIYALQHFSPLHESIQFVPKAQVHRFSELRSSWPVLEFDRAQQRGALLIAISLMRLREYDEEAELQLQIALHGPEDKTKASAHFYLTHLLSRLGRWDESLKHLHQFLRTKPRGRRGREARYQQGRILHQATRYPAAIDALESFINSKPKDPNMYRWFLGWSYFRQGDCQSSIKVWQKLVRSRNLVVGPKARYWTARCHALNGAKRSALRELRALLKESPLGYYALLAQTLRSRLLKVKFSWSNPLRKSREKHWRYAAPPVPKSSIKRLRKYKSTKELYRRFVKSFSLLSLGEEGLARTESKGLCTQAKNNKLLKKVLGSRKRFILCDALEYYTGNHGRRWKRQASKRIAWRTQFHKKSPRERVGAYPIAYYDLSLAAAQLEQVSPWWIMSHMLQESRYRPGVVSYAQAIGLLQILGRTGKRIRDALDWPKGDFFSDQLYDPALSIRYAAWYLHNLSDDLGHPLLAIGAYNGGPMRFADHQDQFKGQAFDIMVEEMGAHESRNYLRKVADHFIRYLALYASDQEWSMWTERLMPPLLTPIPKRSVGF
ncbi:MAG: hypothetical protein CMH49_04625 [Myxococcales bacterium]|nr:hypothetical protein [Myxococcales bacterium]